MTASEHQSLNTKLQAFETGQRFTPKRIGKNR